MPSINDITGAIEYLKVKAIAVHEEACVAVRNRNARCKNCAEACIADAISVSHNEVSIDPDRCVDCGACIAVCPNDALEASDPTDASISKRLMSQGSSTGRVMIACSRKVARREVDAACHVEVPCLAHLKEVQLLQSIAAGANDVILVDGCCETCKYGLANEAIDEVVEQCSRLLDVTMAGAAITRMSEFPDDIERLDPSSNRGEDRRGLLRQTGSYMRAVASNVVQKTMESNPVLGDPHKRTLKDRLVEARTGALRKLVPNDNYRIIDAMERLGAAREAASQDRIDTRHFGNVEIDVGKCSGCGMCVLFCPTQALRYDEFDVPIDAAHRFVEFSASECTQCRLCSDVCIRKCLNVRSEVLLGSIFEMEPKKLEISKPTNRTTVEAMIRKSTS